MNSLYLVQKLFLLSITLCLNHVQNYTAKIPASYFVTYDVVAHTLYYLSYQLVVANSMQI